MVVFLLVATIVHIVASMRLSDLMSAKSFALSPFPQLQHDHIGAYSEEELVAALDDERLLLAIQFDLNCMLYMRYLDESLFSEKFQKDFTSARNQGAVAKGIIQGTLAAVSGGVFDIPVEVIEDAAKAISNVVIAQGFSANVMELQQGRVDLAQRLIVNGGDAVTTYWSDMKFGFLYEAYLNVERALLNLEANVPVVVKQSTIKESRTPGAKLLGQVDAGTLLDSVGKPIGDYVKVAFDNYRSAGFMQMESIMPQAWYICKAEQGIAIYSRQDPDQPTDGVILLGDEFTVVEKRMREGRTFVNGIERKDHEIWRLGDGRGWIHMPETVQGPLDLTEVEASSVKVNAGATLAPQVSANGNAALDAVGTAMNNPATTVGKLILVGGLGIAAIFTGGATLAAIPVIGLTDATLVTSVGVARNGVLSELVAYIVAAVARFEKQIFAGSSGHAPCDIVSAAKGEGGACGSDEVCLRSGAFIRRHARHRTGYCVKHAWSSMPLGSICMQHTDCASGFCKQTVYGDQSYENLYKALFGTCRQPCSKDDGDRCIPLPNHDFGWIRD